MNFDHECIQAYVLLVWEVVLKGIVKTLVRCFFFSLSVWGVIGGYACASQSYQVVAPSESAYDLQGLKRKYQSLESKVREVKQIEGDLSELDPLLSQIKVYKKYKNWHALDEALNQLADVLKKYQGVDGVEAIRAVKQIPETQQKEAIFKSKQEDLLQQLARNTEFKKLLSAKAQQHAAASGAVGRNIKQYMHIAEQRSGLWFIRYGVMTGQRELIEQGVKAFEYGFMQQTQQGNFANGLGYSAKKVISADAFFLKAFGEAYWLISQSQYDADYAQRLEVLKPHLKKALSWLDANQAELLRQDKKAPNRLAFDGLAFYLNGLILGDERFKKVGKQFLEKTLAAQRSDGVFVEHGGYDSSYQAVNILNLTLAYLHLAGHIGSDQEDERALKHAIKKAVDSGIQWQLSRVQNNGKVSAQGNARTGNRQEKVFGKYKDINYAEVALALYYWGGVTGNDQYIEVADKVVRYFAKKSG